MSKPDELQSFRAVSNQQKDKIIRLICRCFMHPKIGFGFNQNSNVIGKKLGIKIGSSCYNNAMSLIAKKTFRAIQDFIIKQCGKQISRLKGDELNSLRSPIIQCHDYLSDTEVSTFFKFIELAFNLEEKIDLKPDNACRLHAQFMAILSKMEFERKQIIKGKLKQKRAEGSLFKQSRMS